MALDRKVFFDRVRKAPFSGSMTLGQVEGMNAILDEWERQKLKDLRWLAYMMATAFHETATTMQPVIETRQPKEATNPSVDTAIARLERAWAAGKMPWVKTAYWRKDAHGQSWLGRGLPQVTHEYNYARAEKETGIPFTRDPSLMLIMANAVPVMFSGMIKGWFTGRKLSDYFGGAKADSFNARRIINATQKAAVVADHYNDFHGALIAASDTNPRIPPPPDIPKPKPAEPAKGGWLAKLIEAVFGKRG
jgi:predicted chitinase